MLVPLDMQKLLEYCCGMVLTQIQGITGTTRHYMKQLWKAKWMFVWVGNFSLGLYEAKFNLDLVKIKPMLVSGVCRSCTPIWHVGLGWASDDAYSLWEVMLFRATNSVFVWQFAPSFFPASWLALASIEVGKYCIYTEFISVMVPLSGLPWIPAHPSWGLHFTWHYHLLSWTPSSSSSIGDEFN